MRRLLRSVLFQTRSGFSSRKGVDVEIWVRLTEKVALQQYRVSGARFDSICFAFRVVSLRNGWGSLLLWYREGMLLYAFRSLLVCTILRVCKSALRSGRCRLPIQETRVVPLVRLRISRVSWYHLLSFRYSRRGRIRVHVSSPPLDGVSSMGFLRQFIQRVKATLPVANFSEKLLYSGDSSVNHLALTFLGRLRNSGFLRSEYVGAPVWRRRSCTSEIVKMDTSESTRKIWAFLSLFAWRFLHVLGANCR